MDTILVKDGKNRVTVSVAEKGATGPAGPQGQSANLVPANSTTLGGIIVGDNLSITGNGVLSVANTFQPKLANTTYGLTDTGLINNESEYYVNGEYVNKGLDKYYTGLRGQKYLPTGELYGELYAVGSYKYNANGTLIKASSLEFDGLNSYLISSDSTGFSLVSFSAGTVALITNNATESCNLYVGSGVVSGKAATSFFELRGNQGGTGNNVQDYRMAFGPSSQFDRGIVFQQVSWKSTIGFNYYSAVSGVEYAMTNGLSFDNTPSLGGFTGTPGTHTSFQHTTDAVISGVRTGTEIRASRNKVELFYLNISPVYTANSILTQGYADTRYLTSANLTYANITGKPDLTAYVQKTQSTTQTIASTASFGSDSSALTLSSSSYAMTVNTLAGTSNLTVTPTSATLVLAGGGTWTANSILTLGYADSRYLTSANLTYANITGKPTFATVAISGSYTDLSNTPTAYSLPTATTSVLGGIKVGANLSISNGVLSAISSGSTTTSLPWANITSTPTTLAGYGITDGLTSANAAATYVTSSDANNAFAAKTVAINPGTGLTGGGNLALSRTLSLANTTVTAGSYGSSSQVPVLTVDAQGRLTSVTTAAVSGYTLPTATTSTLGGVRVDGTTITIASGVISAVSSSYTLPMASASTLGGVRIGSGISVDQGNGFLNTDVRLTTNTFTGTQNLQDNELIRAKLRDYSETVSSPTISAGTLTLNLETSNIFTVSLNAAITTLTISNPPASGSGGSFTLIFTADGTARAVTWPASIKWAGGTAPTITSTSGKVDSFAFFTSDGGTNWQGYVGGQNF